MPGYARVHKKPAHERHPRARAGSGRKPWQPTPEQLATIERMGAIGMSYEDIAVVLKKDVETVHSICGELIDLARLKANGRVAGNLFKQTESNVRACEVWLYNRDPSRWQDRRNVHHSGKLAIEERPDLSGLDAEDLAVLRQAAAIMASVQAPVLEGQSRRLPAPQEEEDDGD